MIVDKYRPIKITTDFYQLGVPDFPVYLSMGDEGMSLKAVREHSLLLSLTR